MPGELWTSAGATNLTAYARVLSGATVANASSTAFEGYNSAHWTSYAVALTQQGLTGFYSADFPSWITTPGVYKVEYRSQAGVTPSITDIVIDARLVDWTGTAEAVPPAGGTAVGNEISLDAIDGLTAYSRVLFGGMVYNGTAFESYNSAHWTSYAVALTEQGSSLFYSANFPTAISTAGVYVIEFRSQAGGSPAVTDSTIGAGVLNWTGTAEAVPWKALYTAASNVRLGTDRGDGTTGTLIVPPASTVLTTETYDATTVGTVVLPTTGQVESGFTFGPASALTGTYTGGGTSTDPGIANVRAGTNYEIASTSLTGTLHVPTAAQVLSGIAVDATTGTVVLPTASQVISTASFGPASGTNGNVVLPTAGQVESGIPFGPGSGTTGTYTGGGGGVYPSPGDVRLATVYGPTSNETGSLIVPPANTVLSTETFDASTHGTVVLPTADEVEQGVTFGPGSQTTGTYVGSGGSGGGITLDQLNAALASGIVTLAPSGLDGIAIEAGINARQALSPILAAAAGIVAGGGTTNVTIKGAGGTTTRIDATVDENGNRPNITLTLPT